jgi:prepilin-type N-terminal cleavage/methylation domain-containing protein
MTKMIKRNSASGFTLIELLIVIVIIGILAGVVLTVINPAKQLTKARETTVRSNVEKACLALDACAATTTDPTKCDTYDDAGIIDPTGIPNTSTYCLDVDGSTPATCNAAPAAANAIVSFYGTLGTCRFVCSYNFGTSTSTPMAISGVAGFTTCTIPARE